MTISKRHWALGSILATLLAGCGGSTGHLELERGAPIIFVSIDTLRSDRLPAYGYDKVETPALDAFRDDSILFKHAYTHIPLTLPAHLSALTGLLPPEHGVRDNMGYRFDAEGQPYLPRTLQELGYATGAAVSSFVLRGGSGMKSHFDFYEDRIESGGPASGLGTVQRSGFETLRLTEDWLEDQQSESVFLFFHIYEPHTPYTPPEPYASRAGNAYDGEVAASDAIVGGLFEKLRELGLYDSALIVLFSDHGEALGEHDYFEHGPFLYREALQIPLLLKLPRSVQGGTTVTEPSQLIDIPPTVWKLLGETPPPGLRGASLLDLASTQAEPRLLYAETYFPRLHFGWSDLASIIEYPYHYIHGPGPELFDLEADPRETENIIREHRQVLSRLRAEIDRTNTPLAPPAQVDPETRSKLAALGYLGSTSHLGDGPLPDPKDRVHVLEGMRQAVLAAEAGRHAEAERRLRAVLEEEPGMVDAWTDLGHSLLKQKRVAEAAVAYEKAVELTGGAPQVALPAANALMLLGRLEEAKLLAELALVSHDTAHDILAQIAVRAGELEDAERHLADALATRSTRIGPLITQAQLRLRQGRLDEAIALSKQAEDELGTAARENLRGAFFVRGTAYARKGEAEAAIEAFLTEIEISPAELGPYASLAFLYALEGRGPEAGRTLQEMVERNPTPLAFAAAVRTLRQMGDDRSASAVLRQARSRWPSSEELRNLGP